MERVFSKGRLLLSHLRNRLESQTTRALLCLGEWSVLGFIDKEDLIKTAQLPELEDASSMDSQVSAGWDSITS